MACGANVHAGWWGLAGTTTYYYAKEGVAPDAYEGP